VRLLIDTHVFLWAAAETSELSQEALTSLEDPANDVYLSAAVAWEIALKYSKGQLALPLVPALYVPSRMRALGLLELSISRDHALVSADLPPIHADPFDRIMIAQAQVEGLTFVTRDAHALRYPVHTLKA
jgi:PIN domain nuclease of toxin-antitoxin system